MQPLRKTIALACALVVLAAAPAGAADLRGQRDKTKARRQEVKSRLELARASDAKVEEEVARLSRAVRDQQTKLDEAVSAMLAAKARVEDAGRKLDVLAARAEATRRQLTARAVKAYMDPIGQMTFISLSDIRTLEDLSRRNALLAMAQSRAVDLLDAYRAIRADQLQAKRDLEAAKAKAADRAKAEAAQVSSLVSARNASQAAHGELQGRINHLMEETRALTEHQSQIEGLIRAQDAAAAAAAAARETAKKASGAVPAAREAVSRVGGLAWPVRGPVTSEFGPRWGGFHSGLDISAPTGTGIRAAKDGVVISAGWYGGYGNFTIVNHGGGLATAYAHQSRVGVSAGQSVTQGQVIGAVGSTGNSTGPHLHFEVRINGSPQNPRRYL